MGRFTPYSIDFCHGENCYFCNRPLPTGIARRVYDSIEGQLIYVGPSCFKKNIQDYLKRVPNFTFAGVFKKAAPTISSGKSSNYPKQDCHLKETQYLILRTELLLQFSIDPPDFLLIYQESYKSTLKLSEHQISHISNLMDKIDSDYPLLTLRNLLNCYTFDFWICKMLEDIPDEKQTFIGELQTQLRSKLYLTINQIEGYNKWADHRSGFPTMDSSCFRDAIYKDALLHPFRYRNKSS